MQRAVDLVIFPRCHQLAATHRRRFWSFISERCPSLREDFVLNALQNKATMNYMCNSAVNTKRNVGLDQERFHACFYFFSVTVQESRQR